MNVDNFIKKNGISIIPWKSWKLLVWDSTCADTVSPSYYVEASGKLRRKARRKQNTGIFVKIIDFIY